MKRIISLILCAAFVVLAIVPTVAAEEETEFTVYELSDVIDNYEPHGEAELAAFRAELAEKEMLTDLLYPELLANVHVITNRDRIPKTHVRGIRITSLFIDEDVIMGVKAENGFVELPYAEERPIIENTERRALNLYGSDEGQFCYFHFSNDAIAFLNSLSYAARENFMLNFYLSVMDTEEAIGLTYDKNYGGGIIGDVNGDGKINAKDHNDLVSFLIGKTSGIIPDNCDVDENGSINFKDNFFVKKIIIGN